MRIVKELVEIWLNEVCDTMTKEAINKDDIEES